MKKIKNNNNKIKYLIIYIMESSNNETSEKCSYLTILRSTLKKLYDFTVDIVSCENKKKTITKLYELPDALLLWGVIHLKKELVEIECDKLIRDYEIEHHHKPKLLEFLDLVVDISHKIKSC